VGRSHPVENAGLGSTSHAGWAPKHPSILARGQIVTRESSPGKSLGTPADWAFQWGPKVPAQPARQPCWTTTLFRVGRCELWPSSRTREEDPGFIPIVRR
jgi:hypothetical protein